MRKDLNDADELRAAIAYVQDGRELIVNLGDLGTLTTNEEALRGIACLTLANLLRSVEERLAKVTS